MKLNLKLGILLSALIGLLLFFYYFDPSVLSPSNINWILRESGGDRIQHYLGSYALRIDDWHFPITKTTLINYPEGISIVYTDSNIFLTLISKIFRFVFPAHYQFWGIWYLSCWMLNSLFSFLVVHQLTKNIKYALLSSIIMTLLPTLYFRIGHSNLIAHWLILATIYIWVNNDISNKLKTILFWLLIIFSSMIHGYMMIMVLLITIGWFIEKAISLNNKKDFIEYFLFNFVGSVVFILNLWILGYFYNQPENQGLMGFGSFSMNLNAIINPVDDKYSNLFSSLKLQSGAQGEGFQFLGFGIILIFIVFILRYSIEEKLYKNKLYLYVVSALAISVSIIKLNVETFLFIERVLLFVIILFWILMTRYCYHNKSFFILLFPAIVCFLISLSNHVTIGETTLLHFDIKDSSKLIKFFQTVRSSGRFYWVTNLILISLVLNYLYNSVKNNRIAYIILSILCILQFIDVSKINMSLDSDDKAPNLIDPEIESLINGSKNITFVNCFDMNLARVALLQKKSINNFYMAHGGGLLTQKRTAEELLMIKKNVLNNNSLYLFSNLKDLPLNVKADLLKLSDNLYGISYNATSIKNCTKRKISVYRDSISLNEFVDRIKTSKVIIMSALDEASVNLPKKFSQYLDSTYHTTLSQLQFRNSYLFLFDNKKFIGELTNSKMVEYSGLIQGYNIYIKSAGMEGGNESIIKIDETDYSLKERGFNCVSIDQNGSVHIFNFDTHGKIYAYN